MEPILRLEDVSMVYGGNGTRVTALDRFSLEVGYRWLDLDYSTGEGNERFAYDVLTQGPVGGLVFRF